MVLFLFMTSNVSNAQTASCTWTLTAGGTSANVGNVSGTIIAFGSGLNTPNFSVGAGVTTGSWTNDAGGLQNDEYYEFAVTPNSNTVFTVSAINFEHSRSAGNWLVRAYYSTDDFATSTPLANAFSSNSSTPASNNNIVNLAIENTTLKVRIYGWESDGPNRSLRIRNFVVSGTTCSKPNAAGTIIGTTTVCQGATSIAYSVPAITNATGYTWTLPAGATIASGANTRAITVNYSSSASSGNITVQGTNSCGNGTVSSGFVVAVNQAPTVTSSASETTVCSGNSATLSAAVTTPTSQNTVLLYEGFNGVTNVWTKINNSTSGTPINAAWTLRPNGYSYTYPGYPSYDFNSNDNSQFYLSNSAAQGNATTATILRSPAMNTVGYTTLSLEFYQYYLDWDTTDFARVEVSTNGSSWTTIQSYTSTQGAEDNFLQTTINLDAYIDQPTLYVRFKYDGVFSWFWAIDNVTLSGNKIINYSYSWAASPSATAGLPIGAEIASTTNNSIVVNPTSNTAYTVTATNPTTGCSSTSIVNVNVNSSNTWTGAISTSWFIASNWSCGSVPTAASDVTIPNVTRKPIVDGTGTSALANTVTVDSGSSLTVNSGNTLKVTDQVTNNGGTITFEDSASLVQTNDVANSGNIIYKRNYTGGEFDYTYWSSPVASQNLLALSPSTKQDKFLSFDGTDWVQETPSTTIMTVGKGYIIRGVPSPSNPPVGFGTLTFNGEPNNGTQTISVVGGASSNLIGNPYPSAIYADQFLFDNQTVIDGTIYFWTHNTPIAVGTPDPGTGAWAYSGNDYASYSLTGGVGTGSGTEAISGGAKPTGKIAAGQSFFTTSTTAGGTVTFTNAMRVDGSGNPLNNSNFYKTKNPKAKTIIAIEKHRVWLNLTNAQGAFKQTLVGYLTGATNTWDKMYDGESFDGNDFLDFYSINEDKNLTIQGRALPFDDNDEIPLGYRIALAGTFTINIDETDGLFAKQDVYLEDKLTNKTVNLKEVNYTFSTAAGTFDDRFVLRYANKTLGTTDFEGIEKNVLVSVKNKQIKISSFGETIDKVTIFDLLGRKLYQKDKINSNEFVLADFTSSRETYIIKTTLQNGQVVSEKMIF